MENIFVEFLPPWVETGLQPAFYDKESGTVLQQTARMYARVNMLIRMFNKLSKETKETVEYYINQFNELRKYVEDYFENLDVQEEVNNKLDQMAEDGVLTDIIAQYLTLAGILAYSTVADLAAAKNVAVGSKAKTFGYKRLGDGVYDIYVIRESLNTDVEDGYDIVPITSTANLVAERQQSGKEVVVYLKATDNIQDYLSLNYNKTIVLTSDITLTAPIYLNSNTTLDLNGYNISYTGAGTISIFTYLATDTFLGYGGNKNITIKDGSLTGGCISMLHSVNVNISNINFSKPDTRHYIQFAGCKNVNINKCVFNGTKLDDSGVGASECINIDPCNYGGQPYIDEHSVMFDHTTNLNVTIDNNTFNVPTEETLTYRYTNGIGSHGRDDGNQTICKNLIIKNNNFGSPYFSCINICDYQNVKIFDNTATIDIDTTYERTFFARAQKMVEDIKIYDNEATGCTVFFDLWDEPHQERKNVVIKNNIISANDNKDYQLFKLRYLNGCIIENNNITINVALAFIDCEYNEGTPIASTGSSNIVVASNNVKVKSATTSNTVRVRECSYITFENNNFIYDNLSGYVTFGVNAGQSNIKVFNNTTNYPKLFTTSFGNALFRNNTATYTLVTGNNASLSGTLPYNISNFRALMLQLGDSNNMEVVTLKPWLTSASEYFDTSNRIWKVPLVKTDGTLGYASLSISNSGSDYSYTGDKNIRGIEAID